MSIGGTFIFAQFDVAYLNHFSHTLIRNMQNFVPWILPANPAWNSNHTSDHTSEVDIKFDHIARAIGVTMASKKIQICSGGHLSV